MPHDDDHLTELMDNFHLHQTTRSLSPTTHLLQVKQKKRLRLLELLVMFDMPVDFLLSFDCIHYSDNGTLFHNIVTSMYRDVFLICKWNKESFIRHQMLRYLMVKTWRSLACNRRGSTKVDAECDDSGAVEVSVHGEVADVVIGALLYSGSIVAQNCNKRIKFCWVLLIFNVCYSFC